MDQAAARHGDRRRLGARPRHHPAQGAAQGAGAAVPDRRRSSRRTSAPPRRAARAAPAATRSPTAPASSSAATDSPPRPRSPSSLAVGRSRSRPLAGEPRARERSRRTQALRGGPLPREDRPLRAPRRDRAAARLDEGARPPSCRRPCAISTRSPRAPVAIRRLPATSRPGTPVSDSSRGETTRRSETGAPRSGAIRRRSNSSSRSRALPEPPLPTATLSPPSSTRSRPFSARRTPTPCRSTSAPSRFASRSSTAIPALKARRSLARSFSALADHHSYRKEWPEAVAFRERSTISSGRSPRSPATDEDRRNLALSDKTLGAVLEFSGREKGSLPSLHRGDRAQRSPRRLNPTSALARMDLSFSLGALASLSSTRRSCGQARTLYTRALALREAVAAADPANAWAKKGVARAHARLAEIEQALGHAEAAKRIARSRAPRSWSVGFTAFEVRGHPRNRSGKRSGSRTRRSRFHPRTMRPPYRDAPETQAGEGTSPLDALIHVGEGAA